MNAHLLDTPIKACFGGSDKLGSGIPPASQALPHHKLDSIQKALGFPTNLVVVRADHQSIPQSLRDLTGPGGAISLAVPRIVGVRCGPDSGPSIVLGFRHREGAKQFLEANPKLKGCPVSLWAGITLLWFNSDLQPRNKDLGEMICVTAGVVPLAWAGQNHANLAIRGGVPPTMPFVDIVWPASVKGEFRYEMLRSLFGGFFIKTKRKQILNLKTWAAWLLDRNSLIFDSRLGAFRCPSANGGEAQVLGTTSIQELVLNELINASSRGTQFPVAEIRPARVKEIVQLMQVMATLPVASEAEGLERFLRSRLQRKSGGSVTCVALWQAYHEWCAQNTSAKYPYCEFRGIAHKKIRDIYGINRSHSIGSRRGYRNLVLVPVGPSKAATKETQPTSPDTTAGMVGTGGTQRTVINESPKK